MVKNLKKFRNANFDSSKEASWGTERNAKNHKSLSSTVTEKIKKKHQNVPKTGYFGKIGFLEVLGKDLWFFALRSVPPDASFEPSKSTFQKNPNFSP